MMRVTDEVTEKDNVTAVGRGQSEIDRLID